MKEWMIIVVVITLILMIVFFPRKKESTFINQQSVEIIGYEIEIEGAVIFPGTYRFYEQMRLEDIIKFAQGLKDDADMSKIDLSKTYQKDSQIYIPSIKDEQTNVVIKVNVNEANFQTLLTIPSMTEDRAASLLVYRQAHGLFYSIDELINVKNIGPATLEKIRPYITLG